MKEINVYVWWSYGRGDGDGYDATIEVDDEVYEVLKELDVNYEELSDITDPRVADVCKEKYDELIEELYSNSIEYQEDDYREECLIDTDDTEYDSDGEEEQFSMTMEEWWFGRSKIGVRFSHDFGEDEDDEITLTFPVNISNGGYIEIDYDLDSDDYETLLSYKQKYDDMEEDAEEFEDVEELHNLYDEIVEEAYDEMANGLMADPEAAQELIGERDYTFDNVRDYITDNFTLSVGYPDIDED